MNKDTVLRLRFTFALIGGLLHLLAASPVQSQRSVIIPARSSGTLDELSATDPLIPPPVPVAPLGSGQNNKSNVSRVAVPTSPPTRRNIEAQTTPVPDPVRSGTVAAMQRVEPTKPPLDIATIKRLAELRRELRVADSATMARINLPADDLFSAISGFQIDPLAVPVLEDVVEYLERTLKKDVTIKTFYNPREASARELSWGRTLALIDWLKENSSLDPDRLKASGPEPLEKAAGKVNALNIGETEFVNRIELHLE